MDGVSGVFAVVSLAIQLAESVRKISKFLQAVQDAPNTVIRLIEALDLLHGNLDHAKLLVEQLTKTGDPSGSLAALTNALEGCRTRIERLERIVDDVKHGFTRQRRVQKTWSSLKVFSKKEEIQDYQNQIRDATAMLQCAIMINSALLINDMHQRIQHPVSVSYRTLDDQECQKSSSKVSNVFDRAAKVKHSNRNSAVLCTNVHTYNRFYDGILGRFTFGTTFKNRVLNPSTVEKKVIAEETVIFGTSSLISRGFEIRLANSLGRISRTLNTYPVMDLNEDHLAMCSSGDISGLQTAFEDGALSPFVTDINGKTLLHYAAWNFQADLCSWLLGLGVDPDRKNSFGQTALQRVALPGVCDELGDKLPLYTREIVDTLRVLVQAQADFTQWDAVDFSLLYCGPSEGTELLIHQEQVQVTASEQDNRSVWSQALANTLRRYGNGYSQLENAIRLFLRQGVDPFSPVSDSGCHSEPTLFIDCQCQCPNNPSYTLLDALFHGTRTPVEAKNASHSWLQILAGEGYNTAAYLEKEIEYHGKCQQFTFCEYWVRCGIPRQLLFELGSEPSVSWDWWIDPDSSTFSLRTAFKELTMLSFWDRPIHPRQWSETWPFIAPAWSWQHEMKYESMYVLLDRLNPWDYLDDIAQIRSGRWLAKRTRKLARAHRSRKCSTMPGAWPTRGTA